MLQQPKERYPVDRYPACAAAIELGVDLTLLEENLRLTPAERLQALMRQLRLHEQLQAITLSPEQREAIELRRVRRKLEGYGLIDPKGEHA